MKKIAFHSNQLGLRGTEVALYSYAKYNEEVLGNKSYIVSFPDKDLSALQKFKDRFDVHLLYWHEYQKFMEENEIDYLYMIKAGDSDGYVLDSVPTLVHAVFCVNQPHGHKYFYVSDWLAKNQGYSPETHSIPHICEQLPYPKCDFRQKHNIPSDVTVFGCYGGYYEFNISWVKDAIKNTVQNRSDIFFIYMNIEKFIDHPNVIFLEGTSNLEEKSSFVHACDAMIHARSGGETFGLAVSEFALSNKPIVTFELSGERSHIEILGDKGIYYKNYEEVYDIINNLENYKKYYNYYEPYLKFNPIDIMNKFEKLLLK